MPNLHDARATYPASLAFLVSRDEIPLLLDARGLLGCGVEVGVKEGIFSAHLLSNWSGCHLISVDPWLEDAAESYRDIANVPQTQHERFYHEALARLAPFPGRSTVWRMTSLEAAARIPHHSLDFVYLDARHDYASVMEDLEAWFDRVRPGGILAGHDYLDGSYTAGEFGVRSAVDEFFAARGIPVYATLDDEPWLSWLVEIPAPAAVAAGAGLPIHAAEPAPPAERYATLSFSAHGEDHEVCLALDPEQYSQRAMLDAFDAGSVYEPETTSLMASVLRPGDTFIDVGGHVGYFSLLASALVGPAGSVIGFEPDERNLRRLDRNVELNEARNVEVVPMAVGAESGSAQLHVNADNDGGHALWDVSLHPFNTRSAEGHEVRTVALTSLDDFLAGREYPSLRMLKIDAEGSEHRVLQGARATLERHRVPYVVLEINDPALEAMGSSSGEVRAMMTGLGYETYLCRPDRAALVPLGPEQQVGYDYVYNLLFRHPAAPLPGAA